MTNADYGRGNELGRITKLEEIGGVAKKLGFTIGVDDVTESFVFLAHASGEQTFGCRSAQDGIFQVGIILDPDDLVFTDEQGADENAVFCVLFQEGVGFTDDGGGNDGREVDAGCFVVGLHAEGVRVGSFALCLEGRKEDLDVSFRVLVVVLNCRGFLDCSGTGKKGNKEDYRGINCFFHNLIVLVLCLGETYYTLIPSPLSYTAGGHCTLILSRFEKS